MVRSRPCRHPRRRQLPVRAFGSVGGTPPFSVKGEGAWLTDADGNRRVDFICGWGPLLLGHSRAEVVDAVQQTAANLMCPGGSTPGEVELAEAVVARLKAVNPDALD